MTISVWQQGEAPEEADVLIVGAGISGLGAAFWLGKLDPRLRVVVLERGGPGSGASGRNAGFVTSGSIAHFERQLARHGEATALALWELTRENHRLLREHVIDDGGCSYLQRGALSISRRPERFEALAAAADQLRAAEIPVEDVEASVHPVAADYADGGPVRAWNVTEDGRVDPVALVRRLAAVCGARLMTGHAVQSVEPHGAGLEVATDQGRFVAPRVVLATNAYTLELAPELGSHLSPVRAQCLHTGPTRFRLEQQVYATDDWVYLRQHDDGTLLAGGHRLVDEAGEVGTEDRLNDRVHEAIDATLRRRFGALVGEPLVVQRRWSGALAYADRGRPLVGPVPGREGLFVTAGFSGHGMGLGFVCARRLAELLVHGREDPLVHFQG